MWLAVQDRLPSGVELRKKSWKGNPHCSLCGKLETMDHIFFKCILARFTWVCFKEALGWMRIPNGLQDFFDNWIPVGCPKYNTKLFLLAITMWALWTIRNKRVMEGRFMRQPANILFKINSFLQKWRVLLKDIDRCNLEKLALQVKTCVESFLEKLRSSPFVEDLL